MLDKDAENNLPIRFELISYDTEDVHQIWSWRSDPAVVAESLTQCKESFDSFYQSFSWRFYQVPSLPPVFAVLNGKRIGYVRFRPSVHASACEISILIDPSFRGKGYGLQVLLKAEEYAHRHGVDEINAYIFPSNRASLSLFKKAGYMKSDRGVEAIPDACIGDSLDLCKSQPNPLLFSKRLGSASQPKYRPLFIIAEIGSNWILGSRAKSREMALKLIETAKNAGCDAVKFQVFRADELYAPSSGKSQYLAKNGIDQDINDLLRAHEVSFDDIPYLHAAAQEAGIEFMASSFSRATFQAIDPFVKRHKIASYEISDPDLLDLAAQSKKPLILSTGACRLPHIGWAVERLFKHNPDIDLTLLQCTAQYPANPLAMNLHAMRTLKTAFNVSCGLSDHSSDPLTAPVMATALGATVLEKHITLSKSLPGPDHAFALEPHELFQCVRACRLAEAMLGDGRKAITKYEEELFFFAQRALQATQDIEPGDTLQYGINYSSLRPGENQKGVHPNNREYFEGRRSKHSIKAGSGLQFDQIQ